MLVLRNFVLNSDPYSSKSKGDIDPKTFSQIILPASSSWNNRKILATQIRNAFEYSQDLKLNKTRCLSTNNSPKFLLFRSSLPSEMCLSTGPCDVCQGKGRNRPPQADLNKDFNDSSLASVDSQSPSQRVVQHPNIPTCSSKTNYIAAKSSQALSGFIQLYKQPSGQLTRTHTRAMLEYFGSKSGLYVGTLKKSSMTLRNISVSSF